MPAPTTTTCQAGDGPPCPGRPRPPPRALLHRRVGGGPEDLRGQPRHQRSVLLRLCELREALLVGHEAAPLLLAVGQAVVGEDVDELVRGAAKLVGPEAHHLDAVLLEVA